MRPTSSRRTTRLTRPSGRQPEAGAVPPVEPPAPIEDVDVVDPIVVPSPNPATASSTVATSIHGRRAASSTQVPVARSSARRSARIEATSPAPQITEEVQRNARSTKLFLGVLGVALVGVVIGLLLLTHRDPQREEAGNRITELTNLAPGINTAAELATANEQLKSIPQLPELAARRTALTSALEAAAKRVSESEQAAAVAERRKQLVERFAKITDPATDLDRLQTDCDAFARNPVDPAAGPSPEAVQRYAGEIKILRTNLPAIAVERARRLSSDTTGVVQKTQLEVETLIKQERFGEARKLLEERSAAFPKAGLSTVKTALDSAIEGAWSGVSGFIEHRRQDAVTAPPSLRAKLDEACRGKLQKVIDVWGLPEYSDKARQLMPSGN